MVATVATLAVWACGGSSDTGAPANELAGTTLSTVDVSCDAIADIESYRYVFELKQDLPASEDPEDGTPEALSTIRESIVNFLSDMQGEGAFVAPDRSQILMRSQGEELEVRTIGEQSWIRLGATWQDQEPPGEGDILTPASVCTDQVEGLAPCLAAGSKEEEIVNGIETVHYQVRIETTLSDTDEAGVPISQELFMEFSDIDDPEIEIEPPPVSPSPA
jgi:hypothetical protein